jgi:hypothetical protein
MSDYVFPGFRSPFSDNMQKLFTNFMSPTSATINVAGKWPIEQQIITNVASYGKQLGWLAEIVLTLANRDGISTEAVEKLTRAVEHMNQIKTEHAQKAEEEARDALDRLKVDDPDEFRRILSEYWRELSRKNAA